MIETGTATLQVAPPRDADARRAEETLLEAAERWARAAKRQVGAVALPGDPPAARAFDALFDARREVARYVGGASAARLAAAAYEAASAA
jgi:hypothetical protein